jgi:hypothetical protein
MRQCASLLVDAIEHAQDTEPKSTGIIIAFLSHRRCRARMETTGFSIAIISATGSPESTVSSSRWTSDARPTPRQIETVHRMNDAGKPIVRETLAERLA